MTKDWTFDQPLDDNTPTSSSEERAKIAALFHKENQEGTEDVDYVAAGSLLIRADVAKQAGIWRDYFIHFDDVEWCLRIGKMGHRVLASAKSLIWHLV